jgi:flagellar hook-basal body complex protein FliE
MISRVGGNRIDLSRIDSDMRAMNEAFGSKETQTTPSKESGFLDMLKEGIGEVNQQLKASEKASMDLVSGRSSNIHETMLAVSRAELGFNMMVQLRNKALEAYQEVMRMQV